MSIQLDRLIKNDPRFYDYSVEHPNDGVWLYISEGYICPDRECKAIHENTVAKVLRRAKHVIPEKDLY
tara:strand:- start:150 stop:353 length:204 start_codon:yes stop_codon:yes gene_type:complete